MCPPTRPYTFVYKFCAPPGCEVAKDNFHALMMRHPALIIIFYGALIRSDTVFKLANLYVSGFHLGFLSRGGTNATIPELRGDKDMYVFPKTCMFFHL